MIEEQEIKRRGDLVRQRGKGTGNRRTGNESHDYDRKRSGIGVPSYHASKSKETSRATVKILLRYATLLFIITTQCFIPVVLRLPAPTLLKPVAF